MRISATSRGQPDQAAPPFGKLVPGYPGFAADPHPALSAHRALAPTRELDCFDYARSTNPPILHRKETFLPPGHALLAKFARLTRRRKARAARRDGDVGTREGWRRRLAERGSRSAATGWCGGKGGKGEEGNHEIDETREKKMQSLK